MSLYEATRCAWKISPKKAREAQVILSTVQGLIVGAFVASEWVEATDANFPGRGDVPGRWGFIGEEAPVPLQALYVGKRVPDEYRKRGAANPISTRIPDHAPGSLTTSLPRLTSIRPCSRMPRSTRLTVRRDVPARLARSSWVSGMVAAPDPSR